jgi:hypothetical protein
MTHYNVPPPLSVCSMSGYTLCRSILPDAGPDNAKSLDFAGVMAVATLVVCGLSCIINVLASRTSSSCFEIVAFDEALTLMVGELSFVCVVHNV